MSNAKFTLRFLSSLYDEMITGYENDDEQNNKLMEQVYIDFNISEEELKKLLLCKLDLKDKNVYELWNASFKWNLNKKDDIKGHIILYIYEKNNYVFEIEEYTTDIKYLIKRKLFITFFTLLFFILLLINI
jgi:hypothetical protein